MTEDEAKTKWCPKALSVASAAALIAMRGEKQKDISDYISSVSYCSASGCMWWVWDGSRFDFDMEIDVDHGHCGAVK